MEQILLPHRRPIVKFSFIVPMRNNVADLKDSLDSICAEAPASSEVVVVDGSDESLGEKAVRSMTQPSSIEVVYTRDDKTGVFGAMNVGVLATRGAWLIMMPAGDLVNAGACMLLEQIADSDLDAVVFAQDMATPEGKLLYSFLPTARTIWPHHSVVLKRRVHELHGVYDLQYRYTSDQQFFADVRPRILFEIRPAVLTTFKLGGISSGASLDLSRELFQFRRKLGDGVLPSFFRSYVTPYIRVWIERCSGYGRLATCLRLVFLRNYRRTRDQQSTSIS